MAEQSRFEAIKDQILELFPVGSRLYDCRNDTLGTVVLHFKPRGIVLRESGGDLMRYSYDQLLAGQLIAPTNKSHEAFAGYRQRLKRINAEYEEALAAAGLARADVWSSDL